MRKNTARQMVLVNYYNGLVRNTLPMMTRQEAAGVTINLQLQGMTNISIERY